METELRGLLDTARSGATRITSDLSLLQNAVGDLRGAGAGAFEPEAAPAAAAPRSVAAVPGASAEPAVAAPEPAAGFNDFDDAPAEVQAPASDRPADEEGARLIALNMALNGTPREETEQYLQENFDLPDPEALLDDVYARAGQ